jgi:hypothetical protein
MDTLISLLFISADLRNDPFTEEMLQFLFKQVPGVRAHFVAPPLLTFSLAEEVRNAEICVADLTGLDANVMLAVGTALSISKPLVLVAKVDSTSLPESLGGIGIYRYAPQNAVAFFQFLREILAELSRKNLLRVAENHATLRVLSSGGIAVSDARCLLDAFQSAYEGVASLEMMLESGANDLVGEMWKTSRVAFGQSSDPLGDQSLMLLPSERLVLAAVELHSPGFWDFVGKVNPLRILLEYLRDRHERRKDKDYRNSAEAEKLRLENERRHLENQQLAMEVLQRHITLARGLGISRRDLVPLVNARVLAPLDRLAQLQDSGLIGEVRLTTPGKRTP